MDTKVLEEQPSSVFSSTEFSCRRLSFNPRSCTLLRLRNYHLSLANEKLDAQIF